MNEHIIEEIQCELQRLGAAEALVKMDEHFEPAAGKLVHFQMGMAYWHFLPGALLPLLRELPDGAGCDAIRQTIERNATSVWHGPSPKGSRDTSP